MVIAKAPVAGRVKTRLCPPCTPAQAAALAEAALADTLDCVRATAAERRTLVLDGRPGPWLPDGFELIAQREGGLDERLAGAFEDAGWPALLVGMDTPQLTPALLSQGLEAMARDGVDAVLGAAPDGGYWAVGVRDPGVAGAGALFRGVPMSQAGTAAAQRARLAEHGQFSHPQPVLRDVDTVADAVGVAALAPAGRFAAAVAAAGLCGAGTRARRGVDAQSSHREA